MNRYNKELIRKSLHSSLNHLSDRQQQEFVDRFGRNGMISSKRVINTIDNKLLKIAQRHIENVLSHNIE